METLYEDLCAAAGREKVKRDALLKRYTTFRIGGPADILVNVSDTASLVRVMTVLLEHDAPYFMIGRGSNLVFADGGFRGTVVRSCEGTGSEGFRIVSDNEEEAVVYGFAGSTLSSLSSYACDNELTGLEFASGIPGSIGGGVLMNAGAYGGELSQCVIKSTYLDLSGDRPLEGQLEGEAQKFGYRDSAYQHNGFIVTGAFFRLGKGRAREEIASKMRELNARRRDKQPLEFPSAGSAFKRPPGDFAGRLIEASGLKGFRIGGAQVSEKHCGFIVNRGGATAEDVKAVINAVRERVFADSGVMLEPEIKFAKER
ncbi:MAG: UDP-N-acetylmuramate dehydrogenase [Clostridia bacterium]|nr:UDP-N-acetylmuramate dehydrogenase [Clostridia bacterium]